MEKIRKTLYWIDREWYDNDDNIVAGDMGFTFCDSKDTRQENCDELINGLKEFADFEIDEAKEDCGEDYLADNADFPIYSVYKAEFEYELEDDEDDWSDFHADEVDDTREVVFTCAFCTSERLNKLKASGCEIEVDYCAVDYYHKKNN